MSESDLVSVSILDKEYQVACKPDEREELLQTASELDGRMRAVRKSGTIVGLERIAIMVALNLCHELRNSTPSTGAADFNADLARLSDKIDAALSE